MSAPSRLAVEGLTVTASTGAGNVDVVEGLDFCVEAGQITGLLGESGCGKSVTALAIMGLLPPSLRVSAGRITLDGRVLSGLDRRAMRDARGDSVAMVFQEPMTSLDPAFRVGDQIAEVIKRHSPLNRRDAQRRAVELLEMVGVPEPGRRARQYPHTFSGGMCQRALLAMALSCGPSLLIADEPTTALDVTVQAQVLELIRDLRDQIGLSVLFVTHDLGVVADVCDDVVVMYAGQIVERADVRQLFAEPKHPYSAGLLACTPDPSEPRDLLPIPGSVPSLHRRPPGCRFAPRCPHAQPGRCDATVPPLSNVDSSRQSRCVRVAELTLKGMA